MRTKVSLGLRRLGLRPNEIVAGGPPPPPPWTPADITSVTRRFWLRSDLGITLGTGVSAWADQYGLHSATQGTGANQPALTASAIDGHPAVTFDGSNDSLVFATLDLPATSASAAIWFWVVFRWLTWHSGGANANQVLWGAQGSAGSSTLHLYASLQSTPGVFGFRNPSATLASNTLAQNVWARLCANYINSSAAYIRLGGTSTASAGVGAGNPSSGVFSLGARATGSVGFTNVQIAEIICLAGEPSELAQLEAYGAARYPSAVFG